ncbi:ABC transporter ATP-binding protein [Haloarchaeobius iranensis]|uniref:ABC-2 type transport system ATP-binding protein n=1 Tax=Haloarchaeobius iranensis TaxID=996166 RepID=A0A1G9WJH3_9EURY|nr:ABC transporter ATP-binding protein [Haloarchaeobius iranensis]SDM84688.1 ABC-2 type transport system ATP-binding protein [Haloarchaeobius iranensis]
MSANASLERERDGAADAAAEVPAISVEGLTKVYGEGQDAVRAVDDVDLSIERGTTVGVLGPNGAGKTTTIKSLLGLVLPDDGTVEIAGIDAHEQPRAVYRHVGAMLEGARNVYWKLSVRENLEFFAALGGQSVAAARDRHDRLLDAFDLAGKADEPVNDLSRGQKQKVSLACTLARGTDVVFLDEPTLGLDVEASLELRRELRRLAEEEDITIVLSSHDMDVVEDICDRVVILSEGSVIADDPVDELVGVFETQAYRITVEGPVDGATRELLDVEFDAGEWTETGDRTQFDVTLADGDALYDVLDVLRDAGLSLADIDGHDPDLEEVFLEVTGRAEGGEDA